ncbi:MAG: PAS domain S-box protein [Sphingomonas bacterium]|nr:PAS domain S-box protein [Sphingomonas bacterium]
MSTKSNEPDAKFLGPSAEEILACIADAVVSIDDQGTILLFNPAAEKLFGYSAPEVLGTSIQLLIPPRFRETHARHVASFGSASSDLARAMAGEREVFGLRRDGTEFPAEAMLSRRFLGRKTLFTVVIRDASYRKALDEQRNLIASEMAHRFSNIMAVVNSVISLTARSVSTVEEFRDVLEGRLRSVSRTQKALLEPGREVQLVELVELELAPFRNDASSSISVCGPELTIPAQQAVSISLVLHELTTNAVKYGALSKTGGSVQLAWKAEHDGDARYVLLDWIETGGPPVKIPVRRGFGSALIERCFGLSNSVVKYNPEGLTAHFRIRL